MRLTNNKKKIQLNKNVNPYKNIYITNNKNIFFYCQNHKNKIINNEIVHKKINSQMNFNNNLKNMHSRKLTDFNIYNETKNPLNTGQNSKKILNNGNYKKIKYNPIYANESVNYNLYDSFDNSLKVYKSKIKKENIEYNNDILSNREYYSHRKNNNSKNSKIHKIPVPKPYKLNYNL